MCPLVLVAPAMALPVEAPPVPPVAVPPPGAVSPVPALPPRAPPVVVTPLVALVPPNDLTALALVVLAGDPPPPFPRPPVFALELPLAP